MLRTACLSKRRTVYPSTGSGHKAGCPSIRLASVISLFGGEQSGGGGSIAVARHVFANDVAPDVRRFDSPGWVVAQDDGKRDGRAVGGRVADEPAVADVAPIGLGGQGAGLARDLDGQQSPAPLVA